MSEHSPDEGTPGDELRRRAQEAGLDDDDLTDVQRRKSLQKLGEGKTAEEARAQATSENPD